jgi:hypothetical protein
MLMNNSRGFSSMNRMYIYDWEKFLQEEVKPIEMGI